MKSHLSHILPVWQATEVLGPDVVRRIVTHLLQLKQHTTSAKIITTDNEIMYLTRALAYDPSQPLPVPPTIVQAWNVWTSSRNLALDKNTLLSFFVPHHVLPHTGPSGHMGLFDCLIYALHSGGGGGSSSGGGGGGGNSNQSSYYGGTVTGSNNSGFGGGSSLVLLPDVLIVLAVCKQYRDRLYNDDPAALSTTVRTMALLAFCIYDSYQKKGVISRDTVHRFLTDVHGDDSYKEPDKQALLDHVFEDAHHAPGWVHATVTEPQWTSRLLDSMHPTTGSHLLLDWLATLLCHFIPPDELPPSVSAYLDTMYQAPRKPLCDVYRLADMRLYEIKRRFHGLVQSSTSVIVQGDPMGHEDGSEAAAAAAPPAASTEAVAGDNHPHANAKPSVQFASFRQAVCEANEEMGHGGYMPRAVADCIFAAAGECDDDIDDTIAGGATWMASSYSWSLYHVIQFGCRAVRLNQTQSEDADVTLLRLLFGAVKKYVPESSSCGGGGGSSSSSSSVLSPTQLSKLLLLVLEHAHFRIEADAPPHRDDLDGENDQDGDMSGTDRAGAAIVYDEETGEAMIDVDLATAVYLLSPDVDTGASADRVPLSMLTQQALQEAHAPEGMTFEEFVAWNSKVVDHHRGRAVSRLGPLLLELRLIAAVVLGIPPTLASMEVELIKEIERRHKSRYPQSNLSRRGPRGTVWYIIDSIWLKDWATQVKRVSGTSENSNDGRDLMGGGTRGLPRIDNAGLLAENGSLALRADIRWKHDYEILPPLAWHGLQAWYDGGPPIYRSVVRYVASTGLASPHSTRQRIPTENEIELHPFFVTVYLCDAGSRGEARPFQQNFQLSRVTPVGITLVQLCKELDVDPDLGRLWVIASKQQVQQNDGPASANDDWILNLGMNIVDQRKRRTGGNDRGPIVLLLELKDKETGKWPRGQDGKDWSFGEKSPTHHESSDLGDGIVGLYNMGNTCYMNTSIQCLSHTPIFREYFTSKAYLKDINATNPLGHQGHLAQVSAVLINSLWKKFGTQSASHQASKRILAPGSYASVNAPALTPKTFKESLGKFSEIFQGNEQHDAQELLSFLLDGLSEDLNRVVEKPYIEQPDSDGRPDSELADIWWSNHLKREFSIIVAMFTGQYKSLLTCRTCKYESARFEPFSVLQLPLPEDEFLTVSLILYPIDPTVDTMKYCIRVPNDGKLRDALVALAKLLDSDKTGLPIADSTGDDSEEEKKEIGEDKYYQKSLDMAVVDMRDGYISKIAPNSWLLQDLQNKDSGEMPLLHVYELDPIATTITDQSGIPDKERASDDDGTATADVAAAPQKPSFLAIAQRRTELVSSDYLHPFTHRVFGTPLLLRLNNLRSMTGHELYDIVARRLKHVAHKGAHRFLDRVEDQQQHSVDRSYTTAESSEASEATSSSPDRQQSNGGRHGSDGANRNDEPVNASQTTTDMEDVSAGAMPRYGFRLRLTSRDGRKCLICPWYECCVGCYVPDNDAPAKVLDGDSVVVDWHFAVDVATNGFGMRAPAASAAQDALIVGSPSSQRSSVMPAATRPRTGPSVSVKLHSSFSMGGKRGGMSGAISLEECLDSFAQEERIPDTYCSKCKEFRVQTKRMSLWRLPPVVIIQLKRFQFTQHMRRKLRDLVVFPLEGLDMSRIMAPEEGSSTYGEKEEAPAKAVVQENGADNTEESARTKDSGRDHKLYDLYAVIHHQGALSGGHYVASLKSELDGQWRLFNDAQVYEIHPRDVIDASAYILFYMRRDIVMNKKAHLSDFWDVRAESNLSPEDMDQLLKGRSDRCVIS